MIERLPEFAAEGSATENVGDTGVLALSDRQCIPDDPAWCGEHEDDLSPVEEGECKEWVLRQGWTTLSNTYHNEFIDKPLPSENGFMEPFIEMLKAGSFDDEPWRSNVAIEDGRVVVKEPGGVGSSSSTCEPEDEDASSVNNRLSVDTSMEKKLSTTDIRVMAECFPAPSGGPLDMRRSSSRSPCRSPSESRRTSLASVAELSEELPRPVERRKSSALASTLPTVADSLAPQAHTLFAKQNQLNDDLSRELEGYGALLSQLESKLGDRDGVIKRLVRDHAHERRRLKREVAERDAKIERLGSEVDRLRTEIDREPSMRADDRAEELQEELDAARDKLSALEIEHSALAEELDQVRAELQDASRDAEGARDELAAAHSDAGTLRLELEDTRRRLAESDDALERTTEDLDAERDAHEDAQRRLDEGKSQREQLSAQAEHERNLRLDAERVHAEELADLRAQLAQERALRQRLEAERDSASHADLQSQLGRSQPRAVPDASEFGHSRTQSKDGGFAFSPSKRGGGGSFLRDSWATATGKRSALAPVGQKNADRTIARLERTVEELAMANERLSLGMSSLQQERELLRRKLQRAEGGARHPSKTHARTSSKDSLAGRPTSLRS